jgi:hypothetical protein
METRDIAATLIGLEAGLGIGLLAFGTTLLRRWGWRSSARRRLAVRKGRLQLIRRALRSQMRAAR